MTHHERIPYPAALDHRRVESTHTAEIRTTPGKIFPLACPVEELRRIPDREYELVYSRSGVNANHCIFRERLSGPLFLGAPIPTTWHTTLYDPERCRVRFLLMIGGSATIQWELTCRETGRDTTTVTLHRVFTALDEGGRRADRGRDPGEAGGHRHVPVSAPAARLRNRKDAGPRSGGPDAGRLRRSVKAEAEIEKRGFRADVPGRVNPPGS